MKRLLIQILFIYPVASLVLTASTVKTDGSGRNYETFFTQNRDTSNPDSTIKIEPFNLEIVAPSSGIQFYKDGIIFLSHSKMEDRMISDHVSFGTLGTYYALVNDSVPGEHELFSGADPFPVPSESMTFNSDYSVMYYAKRLKNDDAEKIYKAEYRPGKDGSGAWVSENDPLSMCADNSTYTHPALSLSGDMMVFSSDRRGNSGGLDLYITHKTGGSWSSPENLGKSVNTNGNELFPFLDKDNNLYFSSDGHKGIGGYDIYVSRFNGKYWDKPVNLTNAINSVNDELALRINRNNGNSAFFSTRQKSDDRSFQLHIITFHDNYSLNRFSDLTNALKFIAGFDVSPFKTEGQDSQVLAEVKPPESGTDKTVKEPEKRPVTKSEQIQKPSEKLPVTKPADVSEPQEATDAIIYRIQFLASSKSKGSYDMNIGDKTYRTFEYLYNGLYRTCAGEYSSVASAKDFVNLVKQAGYQDAFLVAFKNNQRVDLRTVEKTGSDYPAVAQNNPPETKPAQTNAEPLKKTETKPEASRPAEFSQPQTGADAIIYRIQLLTSSKSKGTYDVTIGDKTFSTFEYFFSGSYRTCIGEFGAVTSAKDFVKTVKQAGYTDAFVVVFKNNQRSLDPALLK
jgi:hypothetical protein